MLLGKNLIAGRPVESGEGRFTAGGALAQFEEASNAHVDRAMEEAAAAFLPYRRLSAEVRAVFLEHIAAEHPALGLEALIAWAKYLEHERRDFDKAQGVVDRALVRIQLRHGPSPDAAIDALRQALEYRLARIVRRQGRRDPSGMK